MRKREERFTRPEFLDRALEPRALWAAAEVWRGLFVHWGFLRFGWYQLRSEVWGFARRERAPVEAALRQAVAAGGAACEVSVADGDRVVVAGGWGPLDGAAATMPWLAPLLAPACAGLLVVLRMEVCDVAPEARRLPRSSNSLVMAGVAGERSLLLKACGQSTESAISERLCHGMAWPHEQAFLRSVDAFLRATEVCRPEGNAIVPTAVASAEAMRKAWVSGGAIVSDFCTRRTERAGSWIARHFVEFPDDRSPGAFLRRCAFPLAMALVCAGVAWRVRGMFAPSAVGAMLGLALLCRVVWTKLKMILLYHRQMSWGLGALYAKPLVFERRVIEPEPLSEPAVRKYSADLVAAGAEHCYDFRLTFRTEDASHSRLFVRRECDAYVTLSVLTRTGQFRQFPGVPIFVLTTYFGDGTRCATLSSAKTYRKAMDPRMVGVARAGTTDVGELMRIHGELVGRQVAAGRVTEPVDPDSYERKTLAEHEESRGYYVTHPIYSWGDAVHEAFEVPRRIERLVGNG
jgi:hypothetical protein